MTIVAGFRVQDGIVMCSDTLYTGGIKLHQSKLYGATIHDSPDVSQHMPLVFGIAGNEGNATMAAGDCIDGVKEIPVEQRTLRRVTKALRAAVLDVNRQYVDGRAENERFDLMIGCWVPRGGGLQLFSTCGSSIVQRSQHGYDCIGTGAYIGHYLIRPQFSSQKMRIREAVLLAIQAIRAAKEWDEYCGGDTQFITIFDGGAVSSVVPHNVQATEMHVKSLEKMSRQLLFDIADKNLTSDEFDLRLAAFTQQVQYLRSSFCGRGFDHILELLKKAATTTEGQSAHPGVTIRLNSGPQPSPESPGVSDES